MLKQLIDYANRTGLDSRPGYKRDYIKWFVVLSKSGEFLNVVGREKESKAKGDLFLCPKFSLPILKAAGTGARHFLVDTTAVVSLVGIDLIKTEKDQQKLIAKHKYFVAMLSDAAKEVSLLEPIATALSSEATVAEIRKQLEEQSPKAKATQNISFAIESTIIVNSEDWHEWYAKRFAELQEKKGSKLKGGPSVSMRSLASGEVIEPAPTHPMLAGLSDVGGNASVALASFKPPSFQHFGLEQSANAAVSAEEATAYAAAANDLIRRSRPLAMGKVAFWLVGIDESASVEEAEQIIDADLFSGEIPEADEELSQEEQEKLDKRIAKRETSHARKLLDAIREGERPELASARFNALSLGANASRLVIRDFMDGPFTGLLESIDSWFDGLSITKLDSSNLVKNPTLARIISAPLPPKSPSQKYADWIKPVTKLREPLWRLAIGSSSLGTATPHKQEVPLSAIEMLLPTLRAAVLNSEFEDALSGSAAARSRLYCRMGLLKLFLIRKGGMNVSTHLNEEHPDAAYHCGRLLAVLANVQQQALGDVGANVIQRFYSRASVAPADAIGPIIRLSNAHLNKLDTGLAVLLRDKIANIFGKINTKETSELPTELDASGQSLFALGYYQQIARDRQEMIANSVKKKQKNKQEKEVENE